MKLYIYLCDNCNKSLNEKEKFYYGFYYLNLCEKCKNKYDIFNKKWNEEFKNYRNKHDEDLKKNFPNLYKKLV